MAKKTIEQKKQEMQKKLRKLEIMENVIHRLQMDMEWDVMRTKVDSEGNIVHDENGDCIYEPPADDTYSYEKYVAYMEVLEELEGLV